MSTRTFALVASTVIVAVVSSGAAGTASAAPSRGPVTTTANPAAVGVPVPPAVAAQRYVAARPAALHAGPSDIFVAHAPVAGAKGFHYTSYDRTYKGIPVLGGDFVVITNAAGQVTSTSLGDQRARLELAVVPRLSGPRAAELARATVKDGVAGPTTLLVDAIPATPRLAYRTTVSNTRGVVPVRRSVVVDATTGAILSSTDQVRTGTGTAALNGPNPVSIATTTSGSTYRMTDPTRPGVSCGDDTTKNVFSGTDDAWGNGSPTDRETGCVDALFSEQREWDMLGSWLGRNGIDGVGGGFPLYVGLNDENAFYDSNGLDVEIGHNAAGGWIGALDVVGHELGHGIDDTTRGFSADEVTEGIADIFGTLTEWYANEPAPYDVPDYILGEQVNLEGNGPLRYMYDPGVVGDPACYSSSVPNLNPHYAAGPLDHWFYLASEGSAPTDGQPTSPTCNNTPMGGIGLKNVGVIFYNAMLAKTSNMTYLKYRTATLTAAKNLDPSCNQFATVKAAWDAVSVPAQAGDPTCTTGVTVTNPGDQASATGAAVSLQIAATDSFPGQTLAYTATGLPTGLTISGTTGLITGQPTVNGDYAVTVRVSDGAGRAGQTSFTWRVGAPGQACAPPVGNPGFESATAAPWVTGTNVINSDIKQEPAHTGRQDAWLDGYGTANTDTLRQDLTLPAGCTATSLSFWLHIDTAETSRTTAQDKLSVQLGTTILATYSNLDHANGYTQHTVSLAQFAGQQNLPLTFTGVEDSSLQTSFVLDDVSVTATGPGTPQAPTVSNPGPQTSTIGDSVSLPSAATGGVTPYTWSATGLPAGLVINSSTGLVSGTVTTAQNTTVSLTATNSGGGAATVQFTWTVGAALAITDPGDQSSQLNAPVSVQLTATGGRGAVTFTTTGLPTGLGLGATGLISGTPTALGTFATTVGVDDGAGHHAQTGLTWTVVGTAPTVSGLPTAATAGTSYSFQFTVAGNPTPTVTTTGPLPSGITLSTTGLLSGTTTVAGTFTFNVTAVSNAGTTTRSAVLAVSPAAPARVVVAPATASVPAGTPQAYTAAGFDRYGNATGDLTAASTFTVGPDGTCTGATCTAVVAGPHTVTATYVALTGTASLTVVAAALARVTVSPATATVAAGTAQTLTATGFDQYGNPRGDVTTASTFSISPNGTCTGASCIATVAGAHTVTATDGSVTGTASLTVVAGAASQVTATSGGMQQATPNIAFTNALTATVTDAYGNPVAGAVVTFTIASGSATFPGAKASATATTTTAGVATSPVLTAGKTTGPVMITATTGSAGPATYTETVISTASARADLQTTLTLPTAFSRGKAATITLTITNRGPNTAVNVLTVLTAGPGLTITGAGGGTVRGPLDTFTAATLASGASVTYTVTVTSAALPIPLVVITGQTISGIADPNYANNMVIARSKIT